MSSKPRPFDRHENTAATAPSRTKLARARQAVKLLAGLRRDFDSAARETAGYESKRYVAFGGAGIVCVAATGAEATELRHKVEEWGGKVQEVPDDKLA